MSATTLNDRFYEILNDRFYEILDEGFIYDTDENGFNMSYGEYAAIAADLHDTIAEALEGLTFPEALDAYKSIVGGAGDDALMYANIDPEETDVSHLFSIETDDETGEDILVCYDEDSIPEELRPSWAEYKMYHAA